MKFSEWKVGRVYSTINAFQSQYMIDEKGHVYNRENDKKKWKYSYSKHNWFVNQDWKEVEIPYTFDEAKADCNETGQNYWYNHDDGVLKTTIYIMRMFGPVQLHICSDDKQCIIPLDGKWYKYDM